MEIKIDNLKRKELRSKVISIRTFPSYSKWMSKHKISPSLVFNEVIRKLMKENK